MGGWKAKAKSIIERLLREVREGLDVDIDAALDEIEEALAAEHEEQSTRRHLHRQALVAILRAQVPSRRDP